MCLITGLIGNQIGSNFHSSHAYAYQTDSQICCTVDDNQEFMGYYFTDKQFKDMVLMGQTQNGKLLVTKEEVKDLLNAEQQNIQSARWMGYIKPSESGEYTFSTSSNEHVIMQVDNKTVIDRSLMQNKIQLEKGKIYEIKIEYLPQLSNSKSSLVNLQLFWETSTINKEVIPKQNRLTPDFSRKQHQDKLIPDENLFTGSTINHRVSRSLSEKDEHLDTDDDSIPDVWEENGYTIQRKMAVKWDDTHAEKGYKKYRSNPYEAHTAGDPYTDYEKASGKIDGATKKEAQNPLVAAYPNIGVKMESLVISKNQESTALYGEGTNHTVGARTSNSKTLETSEGISTTASANLSASLMPSLTVNTSITSTFNQSQSSTAIMEKENSSTWERNWSQTIGIQTGEAAYLGARLRYTNIGTAPAYKVKPTISLGIGKNATLATIKAKENQIANRINPDETYPDLSSLPILLNKIDDFGTMPISINIDQLSELEQRKRVQLDSTQYDAMVAGKGRLSHEEWNGYINEINYKTARLVFINPKQEVERRIAAPVDLEDPENAYPDITVDEALSIAVDDFKETADKGFQYGSYIFESLHFIYDEATAETVEKQARKQLNGKIDPMKLKLQAKMNIQITPKGWVTNQKTGEKYYYDEKGIKVTDTHIIEGKQYYFDKDGVLQNILFKLGSYFGKLIFSVEEDTLHAEAEDGGKGIGHFSKKWNVYSDDNLITQFDEKTPTAVVASTINQLNIKGSSFRIAPEVLVQTSHDGKI